MMEEVYKKIVQDTVKFNLGDEEARHIWRQLFEPFIPEQTSKVQIVRDQRYGPAERNVLDVYFPSNNAEPGKPVVLFMHGGGFFSGDKAWSDKYWGNIGKCFAEHGIVVVIVNHQLVPYNKDDPNNMPTGPAVKYPAGADDVQLAREWMYKNIESPDFGSGSSSKVVLFGHSSGGAHIAANLYAAGDPERVSQQTEIFPPVAGVIYLSVPFCTRPIEGLTGDFTRFVGHLANMITLSLVFKSQLTSWHSARDALNLPTYIGTVQWEVQEAFDAAVAFFNTYRERSKPSGTNAIFHVLKGHNHLSNVLSIGSSDTAQASMLLEFVCTCTSTSLTPQHGSVIRSES
ncbi:uncharacterized protein E0L32_007585 [Thyridium curvatum]|uniref:BD-FAE-like domain-containing protein n=1 Tax=Thyridium curvatum TaxID=1093900 RepID=A0A507AXX6_9PEZI|nr:uncharacterized protein E0L32_007585 [Thyridium curvatum]TPX11606.1 hypothetical protein E0L32_007585 [Thyridium curvatum]